MLLHKNMYKNFYFQNREEVIHLSKRYRKNQTRINSKNKSVIITGYFYHTINSHFFSTSLSPNKGSLNLYYWRQWMLSFFEKKIAQSTLWSYSTLITFLFIVLYFLNLAKVGFYCQTIMNLVCLEPSLSWTG